MDEMNTKIKAQSLADELNLALKSVAVLVENHNLAREASTTEQLVNSPESAREPTLQRL